MKSNNTNNDDIYSTSSTSSILQNVDNGSVRSSAMRIQSLTSGRRSESSREPLLHPSLTSSSSETGINKRMLTQSTNGKRTSLLERQSISSDASSLRSPPSRRSVVSSPSMIDNVQIESTNFPTSINDQTSGKVKMEIPNDNDAARSTFDVSISSTVSSGAFEPAHSSIRVTDNVISFSKSAIVTSPSAPVLYSKRNKQTDSNNDQQIRGENKLGDNLPRISKSVESSVKSSRMSSRRGTPPRALSKQNSNLSLRQGTTGHSADDKQTLSIPVDSQQQLSSIDITETILPPIEEPILEMPEIPELDVEAESDATYQRYLQVQMTLTTTESAGVVFSPVLELLTSTDFTPADVEKLRRGEKLNSQTSETQNKRKITKAGNIGSSDDSESDNDNERPSTSKSIVPEPHIYAEYVIDGDDVYISQFRLHSSTIFPPSFPYPVQLLEEPVYAVWFRCWQGTTLIGSGRTNRHELEDAIRLKRSIELINTNSTKQDVMANISFQHFDLYQLTSISTLFDLESKRLKQEDTAALLRFRVSIDLPNFPYSADNEFYYEIFRFGEDDENSEIDRTTGDLQDKKQLIRYAEKIWTFVQRSEYMPQTKHTFDPIVVELTRLIKTKVNRPFLIVLYQRSSKARYNQSKPLLVGALRSSLSTLFSLTTLDIVNKNGHRRDQLLMQRLQSLSQKDNINQNDTPPQDTSISVVENVEDCSISNINRLVIEVEDQLARTPLTLLSPRSVQPALSTCFPLAVHGNDLMIRRKYEREIDRAAQATINFNDTAFFTLALDDPLTPVSTK